MAAKKWFYALQDKAGAQMDVMYEKDKTRLIYQIVSTDRVMEHYQCFKKGSPVPVQVFLYILKRKTTKQDHTYMIYEAEVVASN